MRCSHPEPGGISLRVFRRTGTSLAMDLYKAIQELYAEKEKLERVIASLEELQRTAGAAPLPTAKPARRRGRKSMNSEERQEVSERMRKYWAQRRKQPAKTSGAPKENT